MNPMDDPINGYMARMDFDAEDKINLGPVIKIDESITFHGPSVAQFKTALHSAVDSYFGAFQKLKQAAEGCANGQRPNNWAENSGMRAAHA